MCSLRSLCSKSISKMLAFKKPYSYEIKSITSSTAGFMFGITHHGDRARSQRKQCVNVYVNG